MDDLNALTDAALQEVRTASYLLHPPLLDEAGIASAARWFAEGFAQRSGIDVRCDIPETFERPSRDCELVLFRILQESLTNVHRHSGASAANIRLLRDHHILQLEIADNGKGIAADRLQRFQSSTGQQRRRNSRNAGACPPTRRTPRTPLLRKRDHSPRIRAHSKCNALRAIKVDQRSVNTLLSKADNPPLRGN